MAKYKISYSPPTNMAAAQPDEEVEADIVEHTGEWIVFKTSAGQPVLSVRERTVKRYERTQTGKRRSAIIA